VSRLTVRFRLTLFLSLISLIICVPLLKVGASNLGSRTVQMSTSVSDATDVTYTIGFTNNIPLTIGSIKVLFCSNSPLLSDPCTPPEGFSTSNTTISALGNQGITDFYINPAASNYVILSRPSAQLLAPTTVSIILKGFHNPSGTGSFYARIFAYSSTNASGTYLDAGGLALSTTESITLASTVPPFLYFCAADSFTGYDCSTGTSNDNNLGTFSSTQTSFATAQFIIGTNAAYGLNVSIEGTTLTSGNNAINAISTPSLSRIGLPQFGFNLRANTAPSVGQDPVGPGVAIISEDYNNVNSFKFNSGDIIVHSLGVVDAEKFTSSFIVNIGQNTLPGFYTTTLTYICIGNF